MRSKKSNLIRFVGVGLIVIVVFLINFFNISLTSLPTTLPNVIKEYTGNEPLEKIEKITIERLDSTVDLERLNANPDYSVERVIEDKAEIHDLLNTNLRVYKGGRKDYGGDTFYIALDFETFFEGRNRHRYMVGKDFIYPVHTSKPGSYFSVLDDNNPLFDYLNALYTED